MSVKATLSFTEDHIGSVGRERIKLLEAVGREGSISAAARSVGLSYKAAWDGISAMQNLVAKPLLKKNIGGKNGGGATLTPEALKLIETFHHLETGLATMMKQASENLSEIGLSSTGLLQGFMMRTSARNVLSGHILSIKSAPPAAFVTISISRKIDIKAEITEKSVERLGLVKGRQVAALIKAPFVRVVPFEDKDNFSEQNRIPGILESITIGKKSVELNVEIGEDKILIATMRPDDPALHGLKANQPVLALIKAENIIIATC